MRRLMCVTIALAIVGIGNPAMGQQPAKGLTEIDGKKNPELIPEWFQWDSLLGRARESVSAPESQSARLLKGTLFLPQKELVLLREEGERNGKRREALDIKTKAAIDEFDRQGKTPDEVMRALHQKTFEFELQYRNEVLAARARILTAVSPESATAITSWLSTIVVANTKLFLHELDVKNFSLPR